MKVSSFEFFLNDSYQISEKPVIKLDVKATAGLFVNELQKAILSATVTGHPECKIVWKKNSKIIEKSENKQFVEDKISNKFSLVINSTTLQDAGSYEIVAENSAGRCSANIQLNVLTAPQPPESLKVIPEMSDCVIVKWNPPVNDGGSKITNYIVEKRELTGKSPGNWTKCGTLSGEGKNKMNVYNLTPNGTYSFRVAAENIVGKSEFVEIDQPISLEQILGRFYLITKLCYILKLYRYSTSAGEFICERHRQQQATVEMESFYNGYDSSHLYSGAKG